ncbi:MAG: DNA topoisomerase 4 subunit A [Oscillatoriaceae bacterium SKW80]|nr:DNA topoisomerase 4 subunit A [Oscillatoriaceae bacterium SKYG93]MCX8122101.1 DNA topoisomerase 4 subunit A [Oscillatoriaceae bacterium SKW80]MDW8454388.1 DNA topoisomerase (ATP-hydrolyzing) [Oscillatoriaceae cyanobacterium SKYGB_i_bin93]HIK29252.1 DNA topoisomerase 4 subunit A [Oscillatoriaceae cyanobacterium M7585_C2015_266]
MAKKLNLLSTGQVISTALHTEMQQSYLEYAMSVIVGRALPDVRDGLKPVHRRILYAMHELGLTPDRPFRKCARVVGDVLGKYHPHGDQAVYDALVRMVQDFSTRYPLLEGHGNFGSVDNDPPAAMRYTETRLAAISHEAILSEIEAATVDFTGNFDNSQQEPTVLPAQLPILLLNGSSGIAVGMATNIPPHNLSELVDGLIALIDNPDLPDEKLFQLIPGPDFPTGGEIIDLEGVRTAYKTGRGSIVVRGIARIEQVQADSSSRRKGNKSVRNAIVVTELPYQVNKSAWIEKIAELVNQGKIEGIADIRDESDREGMRVVIELKKEVCGQEVLENLYHQTALQTTFGALLLALVDGQPRQLTLRELLQKFLEFREQTLNRRYTYELEQTENRLHLLEGLLKALANLDAIIEILKNAPDGSSAKVTLQNQFELTSTQADAILALPLRRLTGIEQQNLRSEYEQLKKQQTKLQLLLSARHELLKALKKDLRSLKKKYGDARRTRINIEQPSPTNDHTDKNKTPEYINPQIPKSRQDSPPTPPPPPPEEQTVLEFTQRGYVRRLPKNGHVLAKKRKTEASKGTSDFVIQVQQCKTNQDVLVLTRTGKAFAIKVGEIPPTPGRESKGMPLVRLLPASAQITPEALAAQFVVSDYLDSRALILVTQQGRIKRLPLLELANITGRGLTVIKLQPNDRLEFACLAATGEQLVLATTAGRLLRFEVNDQSLPLMGRSAQGNKGIRVRKEELLVGCAIVDDNSNLLLVSQEGYCQRLPLTLLRQALRGEMGTQVMHFASKTDALAGLVRADGLSEVIVVTSSDRFLPLQVDVVPIMAKGEAGERLISLSPHEKVISLLIPALDLISSQS